ncbi:MAG: hypothetical protein H7338_04840 [Candidatus Sericytochromatia bacterium]|nr:hypothetical protein [Candidatus Sericytochromatia bacterium]
MTRSILLSALFALTLAGCSAGNPVGAPAGSSGFETKLLNAFSIGNQAASQVNYVPNNQLNLSGQTIGSNTNALFPIASLVGTGFTSATNVTGQAIFNNVAQVQSQSQLVL